MNRIKTTFVVLVLSGLFNWTHAGTSSGGGGAGVFCPAVTPIVLDIYEGQVLYGLNPVTSNDGHMQQLERIVEKLGFDFAIQTEFYNTLKHIQSISKFLPAGVSLTAPSDLGNNNVTVIPMGCHLQTIGYYNDDGELLIATDSFNLLSETGKAAFLTHEALYKMLRTVKPETTDSARVRKLNALIFSLLNAPDLSSLKEKLSVVSWAGYYGGEKKSGNCDGLVRCSPIPVGWTPVDDIPYRSGWFFLSEGLSYHQSIREVISFQLPKRNSHLRVEIKSNLNNLTTPLNVLFRCVEKYAERADANSTAGTSSAFNLYPGWHNFNVSGDQSFGSPLDDGEPSIFKKQTLEKDTVLSATLPENCERLTGHIYSSLSSSPSQTYSLKLTSVKVYYDNILILTWPKVPKEYQQFYLDIPLYYKTDLP